jgi:enoyl-CoA hydratase / 3-hydroxyacyl-CoA dehydrogenase
MPVGYRLKDLRIDRIGVVGSGNIGPDIALDVATALCRFDVPVVVVDVAPDALERGRAKLEQKVARDRERGALAPDSAEAICRAVTFTTDYAELRGASLVIEAATESLDVKRRIFARLGELCAPSALLASNSSHLPPDEIFAGLPGGRPALVIHYFYPAERNPLVEIVPGGNTSPAVVERLTGFFEAIGKVPIRVGGRYGFAVNPVFEGLFLAAALAVEAGLGTPREVDAAARRALGLGVGPFTAMNLTGGNPITAHALDEMTARLGPWWRSPHLLTEAMASREPWVVARRDEAVELPLEQEQRIAELMQGAYFGLAGQILDSGIVTLSDLELALEIGLVIRPPFELMNRMGLDRALGLVQAYAARHPGFTVPGCLTERARGGRPFRIDHVLRRDVGDVAVLTVRRPRVLNALNDAVYAQLAEHAAAVRDDPRVAAVVLTGFGTKAFVSGADVSFLAGITTPEEGVATAERSKKAGNLLEGLGKPVVCALNGMALGGGNEIAMCCTARIARKGLSLAAGQPEPNLGLVPGAGATQRLPRLIGVERAAMMLRTGRGLSGREAVEVGLVREEVEGDLVDAAVLLAGAAARGEISLAPIDPRPLQLPAELPSVELGHLSRCIDGLICRAILEGCSKPLSEGLQVESEMFGACCATRDMRIGVETFLTKGPRAKPEFVHR